MAETWQVTCIKKTDRPSPCERIERVGGREGEGWTLRVDEVVAHIRLGDNFWVEIGGQRLDVIIASYAGREYIKTRPDGDHPNSLLSLPECY
jgi:hypothetical protein